MNLISMKYCIFQINDANYVFFLQCVYCNVFTALRFVKAAHAQDKEKLCLVAKTQAQSKIDKNIWHRFWLLNAESVPLGWREKERWHSFCIRAAVRCSGGSRRGRMRVKQP